MSLILDALRKSEAERRRGQAPDLFAATVPALGPARSKRTAGIALAVASIVALSAVFYWQRPALAPAPAIPSESAAGAADVSPPASGPAPPVAAAAPVRAPAPLPAAGRVADAVPAPPPPPAAPAAVVAQAPVITGAAAGSLPSAQASPPADVAEPVTTAPPPSLETIPPIAILGPAERAALPPMKLSMHVWNSDAGKRFAIIDGQRIAEGSLLGSSVVEEIRRDGVVLNINGRRVLLSRP